MEWTAFSWPAIAFSGTVFIAMAQKATALAEKAVFFDKIAMSYAEKAMPEARGAVAFAEKAVAIFLGAVLGLTKAVSLGKIAGEGPMKVESTFQGAVFIAS